MRARLRLAAWWEHLRVSLWLLPTLFVLVALVAGTALAHAPPVTGGLVGTLLFGGDAQAARSILGVVAGAMITVTALTFSLTVVALQMASAQFSPRILREFLTDRGSEAVLAILLAAFAYSLAVVRAIPDQPPGGEAVPALAVSVGIVLALVAVGALVFFIHHLTRQLRIDTVMDDIVTSTLRTIDHVYPDPVGATVVDRALPRPRRVHRVSARRSGYLQAVTVDGLVTAARRLDAVVRLRSAVGVQIPEGATLAWMWPRDGRQDPALDAEAWDRATHDHVHLGAERTLQQDVAFGLQQLVDIATRALSPGMNDPATAVDALGRMSRLVCRLATRDVDVGVKVDCDGAVRAILPVPSFADLLALVCDQPRRYGGRDPRVLLAVIRLLDDAAELCTTGPQCAAVARERDRTVEIALRELDATDAAVVVGAADGVATTLGQRGRLLPAAAPAREPRG